MLLLKLIPFCKSKVTRSSASLAQGDALERVTVTIIDCLLYYYTAKPKKKNEEKPFHF